MKGKQARALRKRLGLRQAEFWKLIGVSQHMGSRYENNNAVSLPRNIELLLRLVYGTKRHAVALLIRLRGRQGNVQEVLHALRHVEERSTKSAKKGVTVGLIANMSDMRRAMRYIAQGTYDSWAGCNVRIPGRPAKLFSIGHYGSMEKAVAAAQRYRDKLLSPPGRTRRRRAAKRSRSSASRVKRPDRHISR